ncbi:MAG: hypothetical protein ACU0CO_05720 [Shimia sp.]
MADAAATTARPPGHGYAPVPLAAAAARIDLADTAHMLRGGAPALHRRGVPVPRRTGRVWRWAAFVSRMVRRSRTRASLHRPADILVYAESANQDRALRGIAAALAGEGLGVARVTPVHLVGALDPAAAPLSAPPSALVPGPGDGLRGLALAWRHRAATRACLAAIPGGAALRDQVMDVWRLAALAHRLLGQVRPRLLLVANDHTLPCRTLAAMAGAMGVPRAYVQHGQVSALFPPLDVEVALLDGHLAAAVYRRLADASGAPPLRLICLGGGKMAGDGASPRRSAPASAAAMAAPRIGLALNPTDAVPRALALAHALADGGAAVTIRLHPGTPPAVRAALEAGCADRDRIALHGARDRPMAAYLAEIDGQVAGESSIHVDAALAGVPSWYATLHDQTALIDYYGFVAAGVIPALPARDGRPDPAPLLDGRAWPNPDHALVRVSESQGTVWQGREAELAARTLARWLAGRSLGPMPYPHGVALPGGGTLHALHPLAPDGRAREGGMRGTTPAAAPQPSQPRDTLR